jgi:hypothetical protein
MAPDRQMKNVFSKLTARQKMIGVLLVVVVFITLWQFIRLLGGGGSSGNTTTAKIVPITSPGTKNQFSPNQANMPINAAFSQEEPQIKQSPISASNQLINQERQSEQQYISKLNELESLKIQRQIAEMNQAIAAAKLATVTAEKGISDLLIKPAPAQVAPSEYATKLVNPVRQGETVVSQQQAQAASTAGIQYTVISVSMQLKKWSAVIGYQGKLYNVSDGDVLPIDGSVVEKIFKDGVVLNKDGKKRKISLVSAI